MTALEQEETMGMAGGRGFPARWLAFGILVYVVALIVAGVLFHPVQAFGSENDDYVGMAERILCGELPVDPYRPMLYPLLVAGLGAPLGDCFAAARIVSSLFAGLFVGSGFLLARHCFGARAALLTAGMMMCNGWVLIEGVTASTDMTFAGASTLCLYLTARLATGATPGRVLGMSAAFALAYFSRYQATFLLLPVLPALWLAPETGVSVAPALRARFKRLILFGLGTCLFLIPHFVISTLVFGSPLHSENWRSIALKHFGGLDFEQLAHQPYDGLLSVLAHDPARLLEQGWAELFRFAQWGYPRLLQGGVKEGWLGVSLAILSVVGLLLAVKRCSRAQWGVMAYPIAYLLAVCLLFSPWMRLVFGVLPVTYSLIAAVLCSGYTRSRLPAWLGVGVAGLLLFGVAWISSITLVRFELRHPLAEIAAVESLPGRVPYEPKVLATYGNMRRFVSVDVAKLLPPYSKVGTDDYLQRVIRVAEKTGREFVVMGPVSVPPWRLAEIVEGLTDRLSIESHGDDGVLVLHVGGIVHNWVGSITIAPDPDEGGAFRLRLTLVPGIDPGTVAKVELIAISAAGERIELPLQPDGERAFSWSIADALLVEGTWSVTPIVEDRWGRIGSGKPQLFRVRHPGAQK